MKIKSRDLFTYLFCFIILLYPFNYTLKSKFFPNETITFLLILLSFVGLLLLGKLKKISKKQFLYLLITIIIIIIQIYNNYYLKENNIGKVLYFSLYLFLPYILSINKNAIFKLMAIMKIFLYEHIFGTFFVHLFKNFYISSILPWISNGSENVAYHNLQKGLNPGLTMHYSTNGIYLSISIIYFFSKFINEKNKKDLLFLILSFIALLLTGKRGHTLFSIIVCLIMYVLHYKEKISKKVMKFVLAIVFGVIGIFIFSMFVPQILNVISRFEEGASSGELLSGREVFYDLAIDLWEKHKLFGNGWGAFSYYFQIYIFGPEFVYGYLDAHNVYLQILCECGIVGLIFFLFIAISNLFKVSKFLKYSLISSNKFLLLFSFGFQIFFLLYCFSGNPLYDIQSYSIYFICIGISLSLANEMNMNKYNSVDVN